MKQALLKETIERAGIATMEDLLRQSGAQQDALAEPICALIQQREIFFSRYVRGQDTLISRHLLFCLRAVCPEPEMPPDAQDLYDWLSENEGATQQQMETGLGLPRGEFKAAMEELQRLLYIAPGIARAGGAGTPPIFEFLWVTDETWLEGLYRPARHKDISYCISEAKRLLGGYFSSREINDILFRNVR